MRVVLVTMDSHLASAAERAHRTLARQLPGVSLSVHAASEWSDDGVALQRCTDDIARGDIVIVSSVAGLRGTLPFDERALRRVHRHLRRHAVPRHDPFHRRVH